MLLPQITTFDSVSALLSKLENLNRELSVSNIENAVLRQSYSTEKVHLQLSILQSEIGAAQTILSNIALDENSFCSVDNHATISIESPKRITMGCISTGVLQFGGHNHTQHSKSVAVLTEEGLEDGVSDPVCVDYNQKLTRYASTLQSALLETLGNQIS